MSKSNRKSIAKYDSKSITFGLQTAFIILALLLLIVFRVLFSVARKNVESISHLNAVQLSQSLQYYLIEEIDEIALAAKTIEIMQDYDKNNDEILEYLTFESRIVTESIDENYTGLYGYINEEYMDGSGWVPEEGYDPITRPWYTEAIAGKGKEVFVTPYLDSQTGTVMMSVSKMLSDCKSVVSLDVSLDMIQTIVEDENYSEYDYVIVADNKGNVVASRNRELLGTNIMDSILFSQYQVHCDSLKENGCYEYKDEKEFGQSAFVADVQGQWIVFLSKRTGSLTSSLNSVYLIMGAVVCAFIVFNILIFVYTNRRRNAAEKLNIQLESIADIYISVHKFDLIADTVEEIKSMPYIREQMRIAGKDTDSQIEILHRVMKALVREDHWAAVEEFIDFNTLNVRLGDSDTIALEFLGIHGWTKARIIALERKNDGIASILWMIENIDEEKRKQSELRYLSETDLMTGIRNRGCGERLIKELLSKQTGGMFCLMDADKFKSINDNYGHDVGDSVIKAIAKCLKSSFTSNDIVLRLGGDEFAAFAVGIENEKQAEEVLKRFMDEINHIYISEFKNERKIEVSIGVTFVMDGQDKDFETVYREADKATYRSKNTKGSSVTYYDKEIDG